MGSPSSGYTATFQVGICRRGQAAEPSSIMRWVAAVLVSLLPCPAFAQEPVAAAARLAFDVVSVKENTSVGQGGRLGPAGNRYTADNIPLKFILMEAFSLRDHQLVNLPGWAADVRFDMTATYPPGLMPTIEQAREMLRALLAERFGLVTHRETRELPAYALVLARRDGRLGSQIVRSDVDCAQWSAEKRPQVNAGSPSVVAPGGRRHACMMVANRRLLYAGTQTLQQLATALQSLVGRPVVDRTGLTGAFDIDLRWESESFDRPAGVGMPPEDVAAIFTALQDQLGLKLEPARAPFDVVVVDAVRRPSPD